MRQVDLWLGEHVRGRTFAEVGGLWGTVNEKVSVALKAGAAEATMIDITPLGTELWDKFHVRCSEQGVKGYKCLQADLNDPVRMAEVGTYDVVHSSGILYHCPNPLQTLLGLTKVCGHTLSFGTTVIPPVLKNARGTLVTEPGSALFVPAITPAQRDVLSLHWDQVGAKVMGINAPIGDGGWSVDDYAPWWWLFTPECVAAMLAVAGFRVKATVPYWDGRAALFLATRGG